MKVFTVAMNGILILASLLVIALVFISVMPAITGGISVEEGEPLTVEADPSGIKVTGSFNIISEMPEDIGDFRVSVYAESESGSKVMLAEEKVTIVTGTSTPFVVDSMIPAPELILFVIEENSDSYGIELPLRVEVGCKYFHNFLKMDLKVEYDYALSETGSVTTDFKENSSREIYEITSAISGLEEESIISDFISGAQEIKIVIPGAGELNVLAVSESNSVSITVSVPETTSIMDELKKLVDSGMDAEIIIDEESYTLSEDRVDEIYEFMNDFIEELEGSQ